MGNGMKITLVILLFVVVAAVVKLLDNDIREGDNPEETKLKSEIASPEGAGLAKGDDGNDPSEDQDGSALSDGSSLDGNPTDRDSTDGDVSYDDGMRRVTSEDSGGSRDGDLVPATYDVPGSDGDSDSSLGSGSEDGSDGDSEFGLTEDELIERAFARAEARRRAEREGSPSPTISGDDTDRTDIGSSLTDPGDTDPSVTDPADRNPASPGSDDSGSENSGSDDSDSDRSENGRGAPVGNNPPTGIDREVPAADQTLGSGAFPRTYKVVEGDTLWDIAAAIYGSGVHVKEILAANPKLGDGSSVRVGVEITLPKIAAKTAAKKPEASSTPSGESRLDNGQRTYLVAKNDNLYRIAAKLLKDGTRWPEIVDLNPGIDPDRLTIGQRLVIPSR